MYKTWAFMYRFAVMCAVKLRHYVRYWLKNRSVVYAKPVGKICLREQVMNDVNPRKIDGRVRQLQ